MPMRRPKAAGGLRSEAGFRQQTVTVTLGGRGSVQALTSKKNAAKVRGIACVRERTRGPSSRTLTRPAAAGRRDRLVVEEGDGREIER